MNRILIATSNPGKLRHLARAGETLAVFRGPAGGIILHKPRDSDGFGYDPLFYFPQIRKTFAELSAEQKAQFSHRGAAFRGFLSGIATQRISLNGTQSYNL